MVLRKHILLSVVAVLAITACDKDSQPQAPLTETARLIEKAEIAVSIERLSDTIIKRQNDYKLYDVRPASQFDNGHIKSAENLSGTELLSSERIAQLASGRDIYLYSDTSDQAAQLAALLRTQGIAAYYLQGGYAAWSGEIKKVSASGSADDKAMKQAVACWFEGDYVAEAGLAVKTSDNNGGYVPPLEPVGAQPEEDALGLGLGLGLGPEDALQPETPPSAGTLKIGEGC